MPALAVNIIIVHLGMLFSLRQALGGKQLPPQVDKSGCFPTQRAVIV